MHTLRPIHYINRACRAAVPALLLAALLAFPTRGAAQSTEFTYQGQLRDGGSAATGAYDITFRLFDSDAGGTQIGIDVPLAAVDVADGLFTVPLDFGDGIFDGTPRWLEIEVSGVVLSPRQPITSAPYAQSCLTAQSASYAGYSYSAGYAYAPWIPTGPDLYYLDGNVGIGTDIPTAKLEIGGTPGVDGIRFPDGTLQTTAPTGGDGFWSPSGGDIFNNNGGYVGIGTTSPTEPLTLQTATSAYGFSHTDGTIRMGSYIGGGGGGGYFGTISNHPFYLFANDSDPLLTVHPNRNIGIGTLSPSAKLHVVGSSGNTVFAQTSGGRGVAGWALSNFGGIGVSGDHVPSGNYGLLGTIDAGVTGVAQVYVNYGGLFKNTAAGGVALRSEGLVDIVAGGNGQEVLRLSIDRPWVFRQTGAGSGSYLQLKATVGLKNFEITAAGGTNVATFVGDDSNPQLLVNGKMSAKVVEITGADLAEKFPTSEKVQPGMVMEVDPDCAGQLRMARGSYNPRVAGIVSGAGDLAAGAILGNMPGNENATPVALSGRVWAHCDTSTGAINPGDLLTTSDTPGHAMKATNRDKAYGAVIGKAMSGLKEGKGLVLVLVNLQ